MRLQSTFKTNQKFLKNVLFFNNNNYIGADNSSQTRFARQPATFLTYLLARRYAPNRPPFSQPLAIIIARLRLPFYLASLEDNISILRLSSRKKTSI